MGRRPVHLEFIIQQLPNRNWIVDLWNKLIDEPLGDKQSGQQFPTMEEAIAWCGTYRPGRYATRSISIYDYKEEP